MIRIIYLSIFLILTALLSGCGSYIVSADQLKQLHKEDSLLAGNYTDQDLYLSLVDGETSSDRFCLSIEDEKAVGTAHFIPAKSGIITLVSNISITDAGAWTPVQGEMIFYLKKEAQNILVYDPIAQAHQDDKEVPFLAQCKTENSDAQTTLSDYHMQSYCLMKSADIEDISRWFDANPLGEVLANLGPPDKNNNICNDM